MNNDRNTNRGADGQSSILGGVWKAQEFLIFERLLTDLSAGFVHLPADLVDREIVQALGRVAEFLNVERGFLGFFSEDGLDLTINHSYAEEGVEPAPPEIVHQIFPTFTSLLREGKVFRMPDVNGIPEGAAEEKEYAQRIGIKSNVTLPLRIGDRLLGVLGFDAFHDEQQWPPELVDRLRLVGEIFVNALARRRAEFEIIELKNRLESENLYLREERELEYRHEDIVADSKAMKAVLVQAEQVAGTGATVLLLGETGTGKEVIARAIHGLSKRRHRVMVKVNCAALPSELVESELFGREKGAYTGALSLQAGRFEVADGSTIFLDEISELPLELQSKLLRVLQEGDFERLGSSKTHHVDVRVIAATNRVLADEVAGGRFREDLFYRLNVFPISIPPLRERREDIPPLVWKFVREFREAMGKNVETIPRRAMDVLQAHPWPGNVRELRNVIERAMILNAGPALQVTVPSLAGSGAMAPVTLEELERRHILDVLEKTGWRVRGPNCAAEILGLKPTTLEARMRKHGIRRPA